MKKRPNILIYMDILATLRDGPRGPTRLAQGLNLNFNRLVEFARFLESKQLIKEEGEEGHKLYFITPEGNQMHQDWQKVWNRLEPLTETDFR